MLDEPVFICDIESQSLVSSFVFILENPEEKNRLEMGLKNLNISTTFKKELPRVTSTLNKRSERFHLLFIMIKTVQLTLKTKRMKKRPFHTVFIN